MKIASSQLLKTYIGVEILGPTVDYVKRQVNVRQHNNYAVAKTMSCK